MHLHCDGREACSGLIRELVGMVFILVDLFIYLFGEEGNCLGYVGCLLDTKLYSNNSVYIAILCAETKKHLNHSEWGFQDQSHRGTHLTTNPQTSLCV